MLLVYTLYIIILSFVLGVENISVYYSNYGNYFQMKANICKHNLTLPFIVDISSTATFFSDLLEEYVKDFQHTAPGTTKYNNEYITVTIIVDFIRIGVRNVKYHFFYLPKTCKYKVNSIGLGYGTMNTDYSLIHQLYYQGGIDSMVFTIETIGNVGGVIHFGNYINDKVNTLPYTAQCKVQMFIGIWSCYINDVYLYNNNKHFQLNNTNNLFVLSTTQYGYTFPQEFIDFMYANVFQIYFNKQICKEINHEITLKTIHKEILCNKTQFQIDNNNNNIVFHIDNVNFILTQNDLFNCSNLMCSFIFQVNNNTSIRNEYRNHITWIFGIKYISSKTYITFNQNNQSITFTSTTPILLSHMRNITIKPSSSSTIITSIITYNIFLLIITTIYLIYIKSKYLSLI